LRVLTREVLQGLVLGVGLGLVGVARAWFGGDGAEMALLVGLTLVSIVTAGCVAGAMLPLILHRFGVDPATSSTPFIATLVDVLGIMVYLGLARWMLSGLAALQLH
jgi:magnesium transporter